MGFAGIDIFIDSPKRADRQSARYHKVVLLWINIGVAARR